MRSFVLLILLIIMLFDRCRPKSDPVQQFIPGSYARFSSQEFGKEYDTLIITLQNKFANEYKIIRRWKYERRSDNDRFIPEYRKKVSSAIYDPAHKLLEENGTGRIYSIDIRGNCLFNGPNKYQKL